MDITSPTARIWVPNLSSAPRNFSKAQRANLATTSSPDGVYFSRVPSRQYGISSRVRPAASLELTEAMGKPVAFEASAADRDVREKAGREHLVLGSTHNLQLQLRPSGDGLLHQHLAHHAGRKSARGDSTQ